MPIVFPSTYCCHGVCGLPFHILPPWSYWCLWPYLALDLAHNLVSVYASPTLIVGLMGKREVIFDCCKSKDAADWSDCYNRTARPIRQRYMLSKDVIIISFPGRISSSSYCSQGLGEKYCATELIPIAPQNRFLLQFDKLQKKKYLENISIS